MSRPLVPNPKREGEAAAFHRAVFKAHGRACWKCGKKDATDAAHVIARSHLGAKARYSCPEANARPLCRGCHDAQTAGLWNWPLPVRRAAVLALNKVMRVPLPVPA